MVFPLCDVSQILLVCDSSKFVIDLIYACTVSSTLCLQVSAAIIVLMVITAIRKASLDLVDLVFVVTVMRTLTQTLLEIVTSKLHVV